MKKDRLQPLREAQDEIEARAALAALCRPAGEIECLEVEFDPSSTIMRCTIALTDPRKHPALARLLGAQVHAGKVRLAVLGAQYAPRQRPPGSLQREVRTH